jgi:tRNA-dihydrouridine synthase A
MMDRTDRHFRYFMRQITRHALLYTEMITTGAVLHGDRASLLGFHPLERPLALQLGGDDPGALAECAAIAEGLGYDEVNLNVGCPSDRVQSGSFGACLMKRPERVAEAVAAMRAAARLPVTVKHRIGVDDQDRYEDLAHFVETVAAAGCDRFTVHARKAWLAGLSPKQNREVPPLRAAEVHRLKHEHPDLVIEINGGVRDLSAVVAELGRVDAVMVGRVAYEDPYSFIEADERVFSAPSRRASRHDVGRAMLPYAEAWVASGGRLHHVARHLLNLFRGCPGQKAFRRHLSTFGCGPHADPRVIAQALAKVPEWETEPSSVEELRCA